MGRQLKALVVTCALLALAITMGVGIAAATAPTVSIEAPSSVSYTSVDVSGTVDPGDKDTTYYFQYSTDPEVEGWSFGAGGETPIPADSGPTAVAHTLGGLHPDTEYEIRLVGVNEDGETLSAEPNPTIKTDPVPPPVITIDEPSDVSGTNATFGGTIDPQAPAGNPDAFDVRWRFECIPVCPGPNLAPPSGGVDAGNGAVPISVEVDSLEPNTTYEVTLTAENAGGAVTAGPKTFETPEVAPEVQTLYAGWEDGGIATLAGRVNPKNSPVTYQFEWGTDTGYGNVVPAIPASLGAEDNTFHTVTEQISGLAPGADYHFRVVATNTSTGETTGGPDQRFTMPTPRPPAPPCANELFRVGLSAKLLDCRAYEQVSPVEKGAYAVNTVSSTNFRVASDGQTINYYGNGGFPPAPLSSTAKAGYVSTRDPAGWTGRQIDLPFSNPGDLEFGNVIRVSEDASRSVVASTRSDIPGAVPGQWNVYLQDNATGEVTHMFASPVRPELVRWAPIGGTPDFDRVLFFETLALTSDAIDNNEPKLYEFADGQLTLASYVPRPSGEEPASNYVDSRAQDIDDAITDDGSRLFFTLTTNNGSAGQLGLYMRTQGEGSVAISKSQRTGEVGEVRTGIFRDAGRDGRYVYFNSNYRLTNDSPPFSEEGVGSEFRLFRYDTMTGTLTDSGAVEPGVVPVIANFNEPLVVSDDGSAAFFRAGNDLYYWKGAELRLVAKDLLPIMNNTGYRTYQGSPNGRYLAFLNRAPLTGYQGTSPKCSEFIGANEVTLCQQVFLYDAVEDQLECVSCPTDGSPPRGHAVFGYDQNGSNPLNSVTDEGRVFYTSWDRLVKGDSNGVRDVYESHQARRALISSGSSDEPSLFVGAGASGDDVFFSTSQQLVRQDRDFVTDVYDARVGGGLSGQHPEPGTAPCAGDGCQGAQQPQPGVPSLGSWSPAAAPPGRDCGPLSRKAKRAAAKARKLEAGPAKRKAQKQARRLRAQAKQCRTAAR